MNEPQHIVFGAGLVGGCLAGGLIAANFNTVLVARASTRDAMRNGLQISDFQGNDTHLSRPQFIDTDNPDVLKCDFLWLTVKCTAVADNISELQPLVHDQTTIICCQNGLTSDVIVRRAFPDNTVLQAVIGFNVAQPQPGHLYRSTDGKLVVEASNRLGDIATQLNSRLLPTTSSNNIRAEQWAKLQLNLANPVNALADIPIKDMTENPRFRKIIAALMDELLLVSAELKLTLPKVTAVPAQWIPRLMRLPNWIFKLLAQKMLAIDPTARTSMWWDLSNGRKTEIAFLNGALVAQAEKLGLHCPVNSRIVDLVYQVESGDMSIGFSANELYTKLIG